MLKTKVFIGEGSSIVNAVSKAKGKLDRWVKNNQTSVGVHGEYLHKLDTSLFKSVGEPYSYIIFVSYDDGLAQ